MFNDTVGFTQISNGKFRINSRAIYRNLSSQIVTKLAQNLSVSEILNWIENETIRGRCSIENLRSTENTLLLFSHWEDVYLVTFEFCSFPFHF